MKITKGFTLIELLVVVLIVGILAAAAVPQYAKAVEKSRAAEALSNVKAVKTAMEIYYLVNGKYPSDMGEIDITVEDKNTFRWDFNSSGAFHAVRLKNNVKMYQIIAVGDNFSSTSADTGKILCDAKEDIFQALCVSLGFKKTNRNAGGTMTDFIRYEM